MTIEFNDYLRYNNSGSEFKNTDFKIFSISPSTNFSKYNVDVDLGFDFYLTSDDSPMALFPKLKATPSAIPIKRAFDIIFFNIFFNIS